MKGRSPSPRVALVRALHFGRDGHGGISFEQKDAWRKGYDDAMRVALREFDVLSESASRPTSRRGAATTYRRDKNGEVVHRSDCRVLRGRGSDWHYANGMSADEMLRTVAANPWLVPCKVCRPTAPKGDAEASS